MAGTPGQARAQAGRFRATAQLAGEAGPSPHRALQLYQRRQMVPLAEQARALLASLAAQRRARAER